MAATLYEARIRFYHFSKLVQNTKCRSH